MSATQDENKTNKKNHTYNEQEFDPALGLHWSRKNIFLGIAICLTLSALAVFGFLFRKEYLKSGVSADFIQHPDKPDSINYTNNYWGFAFSYPGSWTELRGSDQDGQYYFSSVPLNFKEEFPEGAAMFEVIAFEKWKRTNFEDWLIGQERIYYNPGEILSKEPAEFQGVESKKYIIQFAHPQHNFGYEELLAVPWNDNSMYEFILVTSDQKTHDKFYQQYQNILATMQFFKGYDN